MRVCCCFNKKKNDLFLDCSLPSNIYILYIYVQYLTYIHLFHWNTLFFFFFSYFFSLQHSDGGGPVGQYEYETTRRESGAIPTTSYSGGGSGSGSKEGDNMNPTTFSTGDQTFGQNNKYIDRSTRCVLFFLFFILFLSFFSFSLLSSLLFLTLSLPFPSSLSPFH